MLCLPQCLPSVNFLGHIDSTADVTAKATARVIERNSSIKYPPVLAVMAAQSIFHLKYFPLLKCGEIDTHASLKIVRMDSLGPAGTDLVLHFTSSKTQPLLVEVIT